MEKLGAIIGLPVVETETGMEIGDIREMLIDTEGAFLYGLLIREKESLSAERMIGFSDLLSLGRDAVMITNQRVLSFINTLSVENHTYYLKDLFNKEILTDTGIRLGILTDIIVDEKTGEIKWYQLSDSVIADLLYGRMLMPIPQVQIIGPDKVIVPNHISQLLRREIEGAKT